MQLFERPRGGARAVLVHVDLRGGEFSEDADEFRELARSAGAQAVALLTGARRLPDPRYFIGQGKAEEVREKVRAEQAELVLVNHGLSPSQERNLERLLGCRILDRTGLILEIFAQRAHTFEGKLQVELAQLRHVSTRLVRGWTHLERQQGGIGLRGGPGETQLELDRRLVAERIRQLTKRLEKVRLQRGQRRRSRAKSGMATVSLVGYTNAGKSTLFNALTGAGVYAEDRLFATLDPTLRRVELPGAAPMILADTVGFIRHLPHSLIAAFRSTLEETCEASLLLHVIDAHDEGRHERIEQVNAVLQEIGAEDVPQIEVYNKIDLLEDAAPHVDRDEEGWIRRVWVSAAMGAGMDLLREALAEYAHGDFSVGGTPSRRVRVRLRLSPGAGRLRSRLFAQGVVLGEEVSEEGQWLVDVEMRADELDRLTAEPGCAVEPMRELLARAAG